MKREEKGEEEENLGEKLRRGVLVEKRGGPCTPILPFWRLCCDHNKHHRHPPALSARKLAAALWEFHLYFPLFNMHSSINHYTAAPRFGHYNLHKDKTLDASPTSFDLQASASSLGKHVAAPLMQHALQPVSPASCGSSMEMAPYNPAVTPTSSLEFNGRIKESHGSLKTSSELIKVFNRIWSLEEQHARNIALIKALKTQLNHTRLRMKGLLRERQADQSEIDDLIKQIDKDKLVRKSKEYDRLHAAVKSVRNELEDERKLRKHSESLHRKLTREITEVKSSLTNAMKELERERKTRELLEDLCDEFARGIKEYEQEAHALKHNSYKDWTKRADHDRLILHISDTWVGERMQMQLEASQNGFMDNKSIVDKLSLEIESFLKAKHNKRSTENLETRDWRSSLESVPLNDAVSAPQDVGDDSLGSDSNRFELNKPSNRVSKVPEEEFMEANADETIKSNLAKEKLSTQERMKSRIPSSLQVKFEEQMARDMSCNSNKKSQSIDAERGDIASTRPVEGNISENSKHSEAIEDSGFGRKNKPTELHSSNKNQIIDNLTISQLLALDSGNVHAENEYGEASCSNAGWRNQAIPARQRMSTLKPQHLHISDESSKIPWGLKENSLKAKLLEARSKGRSRLKALKGSF